LGFINIPPKVDGRYNYTIRPLVLGVSRDSESRRWEGYHYEVMDDERKKAIDEYLDYKGFKMEDCKEHLMHRAIANIEYWIDFQNEGVYPDRYVSRQKEIL
jgi:hypothetical protein